MGTKRSLLLNLHGEIVHQWQLPGYTRIYSHLLPNGNLLAGVQTPDGPGLRGAAGLIVEIDWAGNVVWQHVNHAHHHDQRRCANGNTLYPYSKLMPDELAKRVPVGIAGSERPEGMYGDVLCEVDTEGRTVWEWDAAACDQMYDYLLNPVVARVEFSHANSIMPLDDGDVLVNFRYNHLMAIIDRHTKQFSWTHCDPSYGQQHNVHRLDNGHLLFFANGANVENAGPGGGSSIVEMAPVTKEMVWIYRGQPPRTFFSWFISGCLRLASGNSLICESVAGRFFEVTPEGDIVWEYVSPIIVEDEGKPHHGNNQVLRCYRYAPDSPEIGGLLP